MFLLFVIFTLSMATATVVQNNQGDGNFHYHLHGFNATEPRDQIVGDNGRNGTTGHIFANFGNVNITNYGIVNNNYKRETDEPSARFVAQDEPEEIYRYSDHNPEPQSEVDTSVGDTSLRTRYETDSTIFTEPRPTTQSVDTLPTNTNRLNRTIDSTTPELDNTSNTTNPRLLAAVVNYMGSTIMHRLETARQHVNTTEELPEYSAVMGSIHHISDEDKLQDEI